MRNRPIVLVLLGLALIAGGGLWLAARGGEGREHGTARPDAEMPAEPAVSARELQAGDVGTPGTAEELASPGEGTAASARSVASTEREEELARALWVEGRIEFPAGTPSGERVRVVAKGRAFDHGPAHAALVDADGRFRVAFAEGTKTGSLELNARYLFLDQPLRVDPRKAGPVALQPRLGGVLRGRVLPPAGEPNGAQSLIGRPVELGQSGNGFATVRAGSPLARGPQKLDSSLGFEFTGIPPSALYHLHIDARVYPQASVSDVAVLPGKETTVDLKLQVGVDVAGRVIGGGGAPVTDAWVSARAEWEPGLSQGLRREQTDAGGAFVLRGILPGTITLSANAEGYLPLVLELGALAPGAERKGVVLRLDRGLSISGSVVWADDTPAEGARVFVEVQEPTGEVSSHAEDTTADPSGRFAIAGLEPGSYRVTATAQRHEKLTQYSDLLKRDVERRLRTTLSATLDGVPAGSEGIVVAIQGGETLRGVVVDDLGKPVERFRVSVKRVEPKRGTSPPRAAPNGWSSEGGGAFQVPGLQPGSYRLEVTANGYGDRGVNIDVPLEKQLAPIRLTRAALIAGVVLTPAGEPAPGAHIETARRTSYRPSKQVDADGRFELAGLDPGKLKVRAVLPGYAPSEPFEVELEPGGSRAGIELRLRTGARLTGMVVDANGNGLPLRNVQITGSASTTATTDEAGAFAVEALEPGTYSLVLPPTKAELEALGLLDVGGAEGSLACKAKVEVRADGAHVVLAAGNPLAVRVFGNLTLGGKPLPAAIGTTAGGGGILTETDAEGAYELVVPRPGDYELLVYRRDGGKLTRRQVAIQGPNEQRIDIDVPAAPPAEGASGNDER